MKDAISITRCDLLHPKVRDTFKAFITECENTLGITLRVVQGLRTIAEQDALYAQGRTTPGKVVTNARGGSSYHNYGLAVDLAHLDNNNIDWNYPMAKLKPLATKYGMMWGGDFKSIKDMPHFELTFGKNWREFLKLHNEGKVDTHGYILI